MEAQDTSVEPGPRGEPGEELATETSLPLGDHPQELPSRFQRGLTFRAACLCGSILPSRRWHVDWGFRPKIMGASSRTHVRPPSQVRNRQMSLWSTTGWFGGEKDAEEASAAGSG